MDRHPTEHTHNTLVALRATPEVYARWGGSDDLTTEIVDDISRPELHLLTIETDGQVVGAIQWQAEDDPMYRHAGIDLYVDRSRHGCGLGSDAVRTLARHLIDNRGQHRLVIDPAADNPAAIRCYAKVGFQAVGLMRRYERAPDGSWHDGLLMDLLADDLIDDRAKSNSPRPQADPTPAPSHDTAGSTRDEERTRP